MQISLSWGWNSPRADFVEQDCGVFCVNSGEFAHENVVCMSCSTEMSDFQQR